METNRHIKAGSRADGVVVCIECDNGDSMRVLLLSAEAVERLCQVLRDAAAVAFSPTADGAEGSEQ